MSIAAMSRVSLAGPDAEKHDALAALQELGCVHVVPLSAQEQPADGTGGTETAREVREALAYLEQAPHLRRPLRADPSFDLQGVAQRALHNRDRQRDLRDRRELLRARIDNLRPWGDFDLPPLEALSGYRLWFYEVPHRRRRALEKVELPWAEVGRSPGTHFVVVISKSEPPAASMPVARTHTGSHSLSVVERQFEDVEVELEELEVERIALTRYIRLMRKNLARADDSAALARAAAGAREEDGVFALQGWAPRDALARLEEFVEARGLALIIASPGPDETPPTRLDNTMPAAAGEDLTGFYQLPAPRDWDPSGVLLVSFALFFAMVLADAAYGAVVALVGLASWGRLGRRNSGRRLRMLILTLGVASVLYGLAAGSYFGLSPPAGSLLSALAVIDPRDPATMMAVSIGIGVGHIMLGSVAVAWRHWPRPQAGAALGWALGALGGFVAWRGHMAGGDEVRTLGFGLLALGLIGVVLFRGRQPVDGRMAFLKRAGAGLLGLGMALLRKG
jgi:V/A-type H+-transporting ATPase subunit I